MAKSHRTAITVIDHTGLREEMAWRGVQRWGITVLQALHLSSVGHALGSFWGASGLLVRIKIVQDAQCKHNLLQVR